MGEWPTGTRGTNARGAGQSPKHGFTGLQGTGKLYSISRTASDDAAHGRNLGHGKVRAVAVRSDVAPSELRKAGGVRQSRQACREPPRPQRPKLCTIPFKTRSEGQGKFWILDKGIRSRSSQLLFSCGAAVSCGKTNKRRGDWRGQSLTPTLLPGQECQIDRMAPRPRTGSDIRARRLLRA